MHRFIFLYLIVISFSLVAQEKTLEQLEQEEILNQSISVIDQY